MKKIELKFSSDATSHLSPDRNTVLPVNANFSQQLRNSFPKTLIVPVLGMFMTLTEYLIEIL